MLSELAIKQIKKTLDTAITNKELAGANIMVIKDNEELFYHEAGYRNVEALNPIKRDTIFRLYSMTKPITAAAVILLMEEGLIDLYDQVDKFLPGFKGQKVAIKGDLENPILEEVKRQMNIMDLLSMTSGLRYGGDDLTGKKTTELLMELERRIDTENAMTTLEAINLLGQIPLAFHPGEAWEYGTSADVLGAIVEMVSKMKFGDFLKKYFFEPLGMVDTAFYVPKEKQSRLVTTYERKMELEEVVLIPFTTNNLGVTNAMDKSPAFESGGAGLVSTVDDYSKFALMLLNGGKHNGVQILSKKSVEYLTTHILTEKQQTFFDNWHTLSGHSYGNLMRIVNEPHKAGTIVSLGEYGWDGWLGAYFANCPKDNLTMLFMMQQKDAGTTTLTRKLRNIILGDLCE